MTLNSRYLLPALLVILALSSQACRVSRSPAASPIVVPTELQPAVIEPAATVVSPLQNDASTPRVVPSPTLIPTLAPPAVSITAVGGDLAIRTGPDTSFDAVAALKDGQSLPVYARSIQDGWVEVPIPSQTGTLGWISTKSGFSQVDGYVLDLPLIRTVEWPFGAYLLNCTDHQLVTQPGDKVVPPVGAAPANRVWFFPGLYTLYDADVQGRPAVTQVKLWPHTDISVIKDGAGQKYTCP